MDLIKAAKDWTVVKQECAPLVSKSVGTNTAPARASGEQGDSRVNMTVVAGVAAAIGLSACLLQKYSSR